MLLSDELVERARPHTVGQGARMVAVGLGRQILKQAHNLDFTTENTETTEKSNLEKLKYASHDSVTQHPDVEVN